MKSDSDSTQTRPRLRLRWWHWALIFLILLLCFLISAFFALRINWAPDVNISGFRFEPHKPLILFDDLPAKSVAKQFFYIFDEMEIAYDSYRDEFPYNGEYDNSIAVSKEYLQFRKDNEKLIDRLLQLPVWETYPVHGLNNYKNLNDYQDYETSFAFFYSYAIENAINGDWDKAYAVLAAQVTFAANIRVSGNTMNDTLGITIMSDYLQACAFLSICPGANDRLSKNIAKAIDFFQKNAIAMPELMRGDCQQTLFVLPSYYNGTVDNPLLKNIGWVLKPSSMEQSELNIKKTWMKMIQQVEAGQTCDQEWLLIIRNSPLVNLLGSSAIYIIKDPIGSVAQFHNSKSFYSTDQERSHLQNFASLTLLTVATQIYFNQHKYLPTNLLDLTPDYIKELPAFSIGAGPARLIQHQDSWFIYAGNKDGSPTNETRLQTLILSKEIDDTDNDLYMMRPCRAPDVLP